MKEYITPTTFEAIIKKAIREKYPDLPEKIVGQNFHLINEPYLIDAFNLFAEALLEEAAENADIDYYAVDSPTIDKDSILKTRLK